MVSDVDVVVPVRDRRSTIADTVGSVLAQSHEGLRLFVVDDGSSDGTSELLAAMIDPRLSVARLEGSGPSAARNAGARLGNSPWLAFLDCDDHATPQWLTTLLDSAGSASLVSCGADIVRGGAVHERRLPSVFGPEFHGIRASFLPGLFLVRRDLFDAVDGYDELLWFGENTDLGMRLSDELEQRSWTSQSVEQALVKIHQTQTGVSQASRPDRLFDGAERMLQKHAGRLARSRRWLGSYHAIAGVNALRLGRPVQARRHLRLAVTRAPFALRYWGRLGQAVARARWARQPRERREVVLHVLPADKARGAQTQARVIRDRLSSEGAHHTSLVLFRSDRQNLRADHNLECDPPRHGLRLSLTAIERLRRAVAALNPDVIVVYGSEPLKYALFLPGRQILYHRIGIAGERLAHPARRFLHRMMLRRPDLITAVSREAAEEVRCLSGRDVTLTTNMRDPVMFAPGHLRQGVTKLCFLGDMSESKRPGLFLDIVSELRDRGYEFDATMIGGGPLAPTMQNRAECLNVEFLGARFDVPQLLPRFDVLVFTSVAEGEGMPGVLIEAGMCGLAVVSTDVPGARDVVEDGVSGYILPVSAGPPLTNAVLELVRDPERARSMGVSGRERCATLFSTSAVIEQWRNAIDELSERT